MTSIIATLPSAVVFCASAFSAVKHTLFDKHALDEQEIATFDTIVFDDHHHEEDHESFAHQYFSYGARMVASRT